MTQVNLRLGEQLAETLEPIFGKRPSFISDSPTFIKWLKDIGCSAFEYKELHRISFEDRENIVLLFTDEERMPPYSELYALFQDSRVLIVPLTAFDPSLDVAIYTIKLLANLQFDSATRLNEKWLKTFLECREPLVFGGKECDLTCKVGDVVYAMSPKTQVQLQPGDWDTVSAYFEVGMVPQPEDFRPGYIVSGTLTVPGVVVAHHRQMNKELQQLPKRAWKLFQNLRNQNCFPLKVRIEDTRVIEVLAANRDISPELTELTNRKIDLMLLEMAVSTNEGVIPTNVDWTKNSQINEGALGIHVGIGDGLTGAHIDFICPGVELKNNFTSFR